MNKTIEHGDKKEHIKAESSSDLANRMLREAKKSAKKQSQGKRKRQQKRSKKDKYYGKSIDGKNIVIESKYSVDKKYREAILEQLDKGSLEKKEQQILNSYLRKILQ